MHYKRKTSALGHSHQSFKLLSFFPFRLFGSHPKLADLAILFYCMFITTLVGSFQTALRPLQAADDFVSNLAGEALFHQVWNRVDGPLVAGVAARSWLWGPVPTL